MLSSNFEALSNWALKKGIGCWRTLDASLEAIVEMTSILWRKLDQDGGHKTFQFFLDYKIHAFISFGYLLNLEHTYIDKDIER